MTWIFEPDSNTINNNFNYYQMHETSYWLKLDQQNRLLEYIQTNSKEVFICSIINFFNIKEDLDQVITAKQYLDLRILCKEFEL